VKQHYGEESEEGEESGVKGYMDLITFLDKVNVLMSIVYWYCPWT
jgi:hypothetical protein